MNTKLIKKLAGHCFKNGIMDEAKVQKTAKYLNKKQLKEFIKFLRLIDKKNTVTIFVSDKKMEELIDKKIKDSFRNKKIIVKEDKDLIAGIRIEDYDNIYEYSLESSINNMINHINN
ncbi:MAG: hypothetical protein COU25_00480 [Candidatus Levybacteria bacterium CG10_big_fil_rev_8_21_14_0_10_35_13]|nr:MAG: hypothetical protein COU25_00480 [Candidatus Levybacteria bacterium CG10_big_fil_rev_8_21_14_0_10_35_13]